MIVYSCIRCEFTKINAYSVNVVDIWQVVQSSLRATPRAAQSDLYKRSYAQCVVLCNYFALRCIRSQKSTHPQIRQLTLHYY